MWFVAVVGITATAPIGLPQKPKLGAISPQGPKALVQLEPTGQAGGAPTSHSSRTTSLSAVSSTPVKPLPEMPPERVKIVTVRPMLSHRDSSRNIPQNSMVFPPLFCIYVILCTRGGFVSYFFSVIAGLTRNPVPF